MQTDALAGRVAELGSFGLLENLSMLGAIGGDIVASIYESRQIKTKDTLACIAGGIAEAFYGGVPPHVLKKIDELLPRGLLSITEDFCSRFSR